MFLKLLKHEYKYIIKSFTLVYALFFGVTIILKIFIHMAIGGSSGSAFNTLAGIFAVTWYIFMLIIGLMTITNNARRFKKSMFGPEGYLTNTLPVSTSSNIIAKIVAGATNYVVSYIAVCLSINILIIGIKGSNKVIKGIKEGIGEAFTDHFDVVFAFFFCSTFVYLAFLLFCYMLTSLSSMIGGSKAKSVLLGIGLWIANIFVFTMLVEMFDGTSAAGAMFGIGFFYMIIAGIEFAIVHNIVKNHLNLQ
ncbi:MAG: hypothetical protein IKO47_06820 [Ruminococcus sp.]|nr:hypothetical protein [Ruminococcus sp.]